MSALVNKISEDYEIYASSFELLTATALATFEEAKVDVVVLEVGMGGRLDATNAVPDECILVSVVTAIDFDHQAFLGSTIRGIAKEKCAILRKGGILVLGEQAPENEEDVVSSAVQVVQEVEGGQLKRSIGVGLLNSDETAGW
jgi:folylpolyglutamate synthase